MKPETFSPSRKWATIFSTKMFFHVDATQSLGKLVDELCSLKYDMLSISAHKLGGPQGIGALILRKKRFVWSEVDAGWVGAYVVPSGFQHSPNAQLIIYDDSGGLGVAPTSEKKSGFPKEGNPDFCRCTDICPACGYEKWVSTRRFLDKLYLSQCCKAVVYRF